MDLGKALCDRAHQAFQARTNILALWQDIAENFYPERADFTSIRNVGDEFAKNLMSSYPVIVRRDLGNYFSSVLRPRNEEWASITVDREDRIDNAGRQWLEHKSAVQRRAMYDPVAMFTRATKEGDHDFAAFGQCVISTEFNPRANALLYRCWHLRDVAWAEDETGAVGDVFCKWQPTVQQLVAKFGSRVHPRVKDSVATAPYTKVNVLRCVLRADVHQAMGGRAIRQPYVSCYVDVDHHHVMEEVGSWTRVFRIPRWQTVSGSPIAYSPATVAGLADARLIQAMTLTLLEAGEFAVRPPMLAKKEVTSGELNLFAGGVSLIDAEYDERLGEAIRPLTQDHSGIPFGMEIHKDTREMLAAAFFLNKLTLPPPAKQMTAFEASERVKEYIRAALPLFEPMELEYNAGICEDTFELLMRSGAFGPLDEVPPSLAGANVRFKFKSPLYEAVERRKGIELQEAVSLTMNVAQLDSTAGALLDARKALREALAGIGAPSAWLRSEQDVEAQVQQMQQQAQDEEAAQQIAGGAEAARAVGEAAQALNGI